MPPSRRDDLINAAIKIFYERGFHTTGLDTLTKESGISRMTLYNHFASKDELIAAALERHDQNFRSDLEQYVVNHTEDPVGRILAVFDYLNNWVTQNNFHGCMFINAAAEFPDPKHPARPAAADNKRETEKLVLQLCKELELESGQQESLSQSLHLVIEGAIAMEKVISETESSNRGIYVQQAKQTAEGLLKQYQLLKD